MKIHELKIKKCYYEDILSYKKEFEIRKDDRDFEVDDLIHFSVIEPFVYEEVLTSTKQLYKIKYILRNCEDYGLKKGYCILGISRAYDQR